MGTLTTSGFILGYTHLQPWLNKVCWGYNYLITIGGPLLVPPFKHMGVSKNRGKTHKMDGL